jgi:hypothetical protein
MSFFRIIASLSIQLWHILITRSKVFDKNTEMKKLRETTKGGKRFMSGRTSGRKAVPEAKSALNKFKYEVANELGVPLKNGYNGDLTSRQNGSVGGYMVKKMIEAQEKQMAGKQ